MRSTGCCATRLIVTAAIALPMLAVAATRRHGSRRRAGGDASAGANADAAAERSCRRPCSSRSSARRRCTAGRTLRSARVAAIPALESPDGDGTCSSLRAARVSSFARRGSRIRASRRPLRAGFALVLAIAIAPAVRMRCAAGSTAPRSSSRSSWSFSAAARSAWRASLVYDGAYAGGRVVDDYVGVKAIAPSLQLVAPSGFGRVWSLAFTGGFFLSGAYRIALLGFAQSFERIPPGAASECRRVGCVRRGVSPRRSCWLRSQVAAPAVALAFRRADRARRAIARRFRASAASRWRFRSRLPRRS